MPLRKGRIVEVKFPTDKERSPDTGNIKSGAKFVREKHPAVVLSEPELYQKEKYYLCAMITSVVHNDRFTFKLERNYTTRGMQKPSEVRVNLIAPIYENDITKKTPANFLTDNAFTFLIDHINEVIFGIDAI